MFRYRAAILLSAIVIAAPAVAQPPQPPRTTRGPSDRFSSSWTTERWLQQLANDLDHLEEDLYYERGQYPEGMRDRIDQTSRAVAHFQHMLGNSKDERHLRKDFQEMDKQIHDLVKRLNESGDSWLRRQASRIIYSDEQVHYTLQRKWETPKESRRELLARQAHLLETEARDFEALAERVTRRDQRLRDEIHEFAEHADHFHQVVESGADARHLKADFEKVDDSWHHVVERVNSSSVYGYYLRTAAQNVNRVHNQIHELVIGGHDHHDHAKEQTPVPAKISPPPPPTPAPPPRRRPAIEFEIPGIGRFQIPQ